MAKYFYIAVAYLVPITAWAQNIWKGAYCGSQTAITDGGPTGPCSFCDGIKVTSNIINYMIEFAIALTVAMIVYGGILMMTSAGDTGKFENGKSKITSAILGLVIVLVAWLLVNELFILLSGKVGVPWAEVRC